jgi:hypothetical protein
MPFMLRKAPAAPAASLTTHLRAKADGIEATGNPRAEGRCCCCDGELEWQAGAGSITGRERLLRSALEQTGSNAAGATG